MFSKTTRARALAAAAMAATTLAAAPAAHAATGPVQNAFLGGLTYSLANGGLLDPPGANDWSCQPKSGQLPVVLVHGTWENAYDNFAKMSPELKKSGLCLYALNYGVKAGDNGFHGTGSVKAAGGELATFIDKVLASTGASKVDIVGHSQGGLMPRSYIKYNGGATKVRKLVTLGATHGGTTLNGIGTLGNELKVMSGVAMVLGQAASDQVVGSPFLKDLDSGGQTVKGIEYTAITTKYDEITTPYQNGYIRDNRAGAVVNNINIQNGCLTNFAEHLSMSYSLRSIALVKRALGVQSSAPVCDIQLPIF